MIYSSQRITLTPVQSTTINIAVFIIWIPAHLVPPPIPVYVITLSFSLILCPLTSSMLQPPPSSDYLLTTIKQVRYHKQILGSYFQSFNSHRRCWIKLLLSPDCQAPSRQLPWIEKIRTSSSLQCETHGTICINGCQFHLILCSLSVISLSTPAYLFSFYFHLNLERQFH